MTRRLGLLAIIGVTVFGSVALAQTPQAVVPGRPAATYVDAVSGLSLAGAIALALEREPSFRASRTDLDVARGARVQAGLRPNPSVNLSHQREPSGTDKQTRVEVAWPLDLFRKKSRVAVAERQIDVTAHEIANRGRLLAGEVRQQYGDVAAAVRELSVLDDLYEATSQQHKLVESRVTEGATPPLERDMLRVELLRIQSEQLLQAGVVERALIALKRVLGMEPTTALKIQHTLEELVQRESGTVSAAIADGAPPQERPDLAAARSRLQMSEADIGRIRQEARPAVSLFGMYMRMDAGFPQRGFGPGDVLVPIRSQFHYVGAGVEVSVPIGDRRQGDMATAEARRAGAAAQLDAARLGATAEIAEATAREAHARQAVAVYTTEAMRLARQNLSVISQTYELGRATVFDVLTERRRYLDLERAFTAALREAYEARQALEQASGDMR